MFISKENLPPLWQVEPKAKVSRPGKELPIIHIWLCVCVSSGWWYRGETSGWKPYCVCGTVELVSYVHNILIDNHQKTAQPVKMERTKTIWRRLIFDSIWSYRYRYLIFNTFLQCCGSGMFIPDPGSWFLPIPDPGSKNSNKREVKKN